ncbi:MAG: homoserine O-acetyltransferase [bacterium]
MNSNTLTKHTFALNDFCFENGRTLKKLEISYESWGRLNSTGDNAILICHALTGTAHAASGDRVKRGWWEFLIGPGQPFDTRKYFILCSNVLGGCSGSTGPASISPKTGRPYAMDFPVVTVRDMVRAQKRLIDAIGIRRIRAVAGGSLGGMQALEWAALFPHLVESIIPIATPGRAYPQSIAFRKAQRKAIMADPSWRGGNYYGKGFPENGIEIARMIGFISYRTEREFAERFCRNFADGEYLNIHGRFEIEQYLEHHGKKLSKWFDANTYLYLSKAMDLHDLGYGCDSYESGVRRIRAAALIIGFDTDILFPSYQQKELADILRGANPKVHFREIKTLYGHDAFLLEKEQLRKTITDFLNH